MKWAPTLLVVTALAGCGSAATEEGSRGSAGGDEIRLAGVDLKKPLTVGDAVRLAGEYDITVAEVGAVYRHGEEENSMHVRLEAGMSPEEAQRSFREESAFDEITAERESSDFSPEQKRALAEAQAAVARDAAAVEQLTVCGARDVLFEFESDSRIESMVVAPRKAVADCPKPDVDSSP